MSGGDFERIIDALSKADRVAVLTGAGVSAESGIPTFRGAGGLWEGHAIEDVATPEAFARDPSLVWDFYSARRQAALASSPNAAHRALAEMETRFLEFHLATQNVDGLHGRAGSRRVAELHGSLERVRCAGCGSARDWTDDLAFGRPRCGCGGLFRPAIVWFGEALPAEVWREAERAARTADVYLVVGTSGEVYPAAGLAIAAAREGAAVFEINPEATSLARFFSGALREPAARALPRLFTVLASRLPETDARSSDKE